MYIKNYKIINRRSVIIKNEKMKEMQNVKKIFGDEKQESSEKDNSSKDEETRQCKVPGCENEVPSSFDEAICLPHIRRMIAQM